MSEIICSWDIGIKNLAYCILEKQNNTDKPFKIIKWNIINLKSSDENKCMDCKKKGVYTFKTNDDEKIYCKVHCEKFKSLLCIDNFVDCSNESNICCLCDKQSVKKYRHIQVCIKHHKTLTSTKNKGFVLSKSKSNDNMYDLNRQLYSELDKVAEFSKVTQVIIENQPAYINPLMKTISVFVFSYFTYKKQNNSEWNLNKVSFYSASNKMKINNMTEVIDDQPENKKYKKTKEMSVIYCTDLLKDDLTWLNFLKSFKKKDDLADSLLQGLHYIQSN